MAPPLTYRKSPLFRALMIFNVACSGVMAIALIVVVLSGATDRPPVIFILVWIGVAGWNSYFVLFRVAYKLVLDDDGIHWWAPVRSGVIPLADLREMKPSRFGSRIECMISTSGPRVKVWTRKGFADFTSEVVRRAPHVTTRLGWQTRLADKMRGRGGLYD